MDYTGQHDLSTGASIVRSEVELLAHKAEMSRKASEDIIKRNLLGRWVYMDYQGRQRKGKITNVFLSQGLGIEVRIKKLHSLTEHEDFLAEPTYVGLQRLRLTDERSDMPCK